MIIRVIKKILSVLRKNQQIKHQTISQSIYHRDTIEIALINTRSIAIQNHNQLETSNAYNTHIQNHRRIRFIYIHIQIHQRRRRRRRRYPENSILGSLNEMSENRTSRASRRRRCEHGAHAIRICPGGEMTEESADPAIAWRRRR